MLCIVDVSMFRPPIHTVSLLPIANKGILYPCTRGDFFIMYPADENISCSSVSSCSGVAELVGVGGDKTGAVEGVPATGAVIISMCVVGVLVCMPFNLFGRASANTSGSFVLLLCVTGCVCSFLFNVV